VGKYLNSLTSYETTSTIAENAMGYCWWYSRCVATAIAKGKQLGPSAKTGQRVANSVFLLHKIDVSSNCDHVLAIQGDCRVPAGEVSFFLFFLCPSKGTMLSRAVVKCCAHSVGQGYIEPHRPQKKQIRTYASLASTDAVLERLSKFSKSGGSFEKLRANIRNSIRSDVR
jgi:hypothetical protein